MAELMKTIREEPGVICIRSNGRDRMHHIFLICIWLTIGMSFFLRIDDNPVAFTFGFFAPKVWLIFEIWLVLLGFACTSIVWDFFGVTTISVSSDELIVRHSIGGWRIYASKPIKLSAIRDAFIDEREYVRNGNVWHRWVLIVHLDNGSTHEVAKFTNGPDADAFMKRYVRSVSD